MTSDLPDQNLDLLAQRVDQLIHEIDHLEEGPRNKALELKKAIEAFHKVGLTKIIQRLKLDPRGKELLFELVDEPGVFALFSMHGLIRADVNTLAARVLEGVRPYMRSHGGDVELVKVEGDTAFVKLHGACEGCSLSAVTLRESVEETLTTQLPQIQRVEVVPNAPLNGMIGLDEITLLDENTGWIEGPRAADVPPGRPTRFDKDGVSILILPLNGQFFAYRNACAHQGLPLENGLLDTTAGTLTCPWHGYSYDAMTGHGFTTSQSHLDPFPLRLENGTLWIRPV